MLLLIILLILLFGGGGFYGYRSGYYGPGGDGLGEPPAYRPILSRDGWRLRRVRTRNVFSVIADERWCGDCHAGADKARRKDESARAIKARGNALAFRCRIKSLLKLAKCTTPPKVSTKFSSDQHAKQWRFERRLPLLFGRRQGSGEQMSSGQPLFIFNKEETM
jgi:hypothetical protein